MKNLIYFFVFILLLCSCYNLRENKEEEFIPKLISLNNDEINLKSYKGNVIFMNLWATIIQLMNIT